MAGVRSRPTRTSPFNASSTTWLFTSMLIRMPPPSYSGAGRPSQSPPQRVARPAGREPRGGRAPPGLPPLNLTPPPTIFPPRGRLPSGTTPCTARPARCASAVLAVYAGMNRLSARQKGPESRVPRLSECLTSAPGVGYGYRIRPSAVRLASASEPSWAAIISEADPEGLPES